MSFARKLLQLGIVGSLAGAVLAMTSPAKPLVAEEGCKCDDDGTGKYKCNLAQNACVAGGDVCVVVCAQE